MSLITAFLISYVITITLKEIKQNKTEIEKNKNKFNF